jgi:hypothetical protein
MTVLVGGYEFPVSPGTTVLGLLAELPAGRFRGRMHRRG